MLVASHIDSARSFLTGQNFYFVSRESGRVQITQRRLGITPIIDKSNHLVAWIRNEIRLVLYVGRCGSCRGTYSLVFVLLLRRQLELTLVCNPLSIRVASCDNSEDAVTTKLSLATYANRLIGFGSCIGSADPNRLIYFPCRNISTTAEISSVPPFQKHLQEYFGRDCDYEFDKYETRPEFVSACRAPDG